jgi:hypothetical protein
MNIRLPLYSVLFSLVLFATASAQIPKTISYQGILADNTGTPVADGVHSLVLKLYDVSSGGSPIFSETQPVMTVKGLFNVSIGSVSALPGAVNFGSQYYLGVAVDGSSEMTPRTALQSAPYALHAAVADGLSSGAAVVTSVNGESGSITIQGGGGTTITNVGNTFTISSSGGGGGTGIQGVQNGDASIAISSPNGPTASISVASNGITTGKIADGAVTPVKLDATGSVNGNVLTSNGTTVSWQPSPGLVLPYSSLVNSATDLFAITNSGTGRAGTFKNTNTTATSSALYGEVNVTSPSTTIAGVEGRSTNGFGVIGRGGSGSTAIFGTVITGPTAGAFYAGTGVTGFSDAGHGVAGITYSNSSIGVYGTANGTGTGVKGVSTAGKPGVFEITAAANSNNSLEATTAGAGAGVYGSNTAASGSTTGVLGEAASTSNGIGATGGVSGVVGKVTPTTPGGYSAGVRGVNNGTAGTGIGVVGYQAGSGWGVYGETPSGFGVYGLTTNNTASSSGVRGETFSTNGIGVEAKYSGTGVGAALEVDNGAIRVAGTNKASFIHTATAANKLSANGTDIDNAMCNGDANCLLQVTQKLNPSGIVYNNSPIGVYYNTVRSKWEIFNENNTAIPTNAQFIVLVIKQ